MKHNRGFASGGTMLLLLLSGSLLLAGLHQQLAIQLAATGSENEAIKSFNSAASTLSWAMQQRWQPAQHWQCRAAERGGRVCVILNAAGRVVVAAQSAAGQNGVTLWRIAGSQNERLMALPGGWVDFCPLREVIKCRLP